MIPSRFLPNRTACRSAYTLVELIVSMTAATFLMAGLGSSLFVASSAFDGSFTTAMRSRAAEVQEDLVLDLNQATSFITRTADSVSVQVPDRNSDGNDETISYTWTGLPDAQLRYSRNGSAPVTVLEDVQQFSLTYQDRLLSGTPLPPLDPDQWGQRWARGTLGYPTIYGSTASGQLSTAAVGASLTQSATLKSITGYFTVLANNGRSDVRMAIYDVDSSNLPRNLLASTESFRVSTTGWLELPTPPTPLVPGQYFLALSVKDTTKISCNYQTGTGQTYAKNFDSTRAGFPSPWDVSDAQYSAVLSIYASYSID